MSYGRNSFAMPASASRGIIIHDEAARAKPKVLNEDRVAGYSGAARVFDIDAPEPESFGRMKP